MRVQQSRHLPAVLRHRGVVLSRSIPIFYAIFCWRRVVLSPIRADVTLFRSISIRLLLVAALAVAFATSGFAHKTAKLPIDPDLEAYLQIAGSLDGICGTLDDPSGATPGCEACRLADTTMTPTNMSDPGQIILPVTRQLRHVALLRHHAKPLDPSQRTRAPPRG